MSIKLPIDEFTAGMHLKQREFINVFDAQAFRFYMLVWHRRARKTTMMLNLIIREAVRNPKQIYAYIAPTYTQAMDVIWYDPTMLFKYLPEEYIKRRNESKAFVELTNGSMIRLLGAEDPDSIRGKNFQGVVFDEWAVFKHAQIIWEEIVSPILVDNSRWACFIFTPKGQNYAYKMWNEAKLDNDWYTSFLDGELSGIIDSKILEKKKKRTISSIYNQEYRCKFIGDEESAIITSNDLDIIKGKHILGLRIIKHIAVDPALGGDECVVNYMENTEIKDQKILYIKDEMKLTGELAIFGAKHCTSNYTIDTCGLGGGIASRLTELGNNVIRFNSTEKSIKNPNFYANKKIEAWWEASIDIRDGLVEYPQDEETRRQVVSVRYKMKESSGKVICEDKAETKKRIGRSPDRGDCWIYGLYGYRRFRDMPVVKESYKNKMSKYKSSNPRLA